MKTSYHSHSNWSKHGNGTMEDFVKAAIDNHFELFTMCEHLPEDSPIVTARAHWNEYPEYLKQLETIEKKYGNQIKLLRGFEAEYYRAFMDKYKQMKEEDNISIWVLGQHVNADRTINFYETKDYEAAWAMYTDDVIEGIKTGFFDILAHPDLLMMYYKEPTPYIMECMDRIFKTCEEYDMVVEINANGLRGKSGYPNRTIFEFSKKYKLRYIIGSDAHDPKHLSDEYITKAEELAKELDLNLVDYIDK